MMDVARICEMLNAKAPELAPELLPNGKQCGNYWMASGIDDTGQSASLAVPLAGAGIGHWRDHGNAAAGEERGDMLDLVELKRCPGDKAGAVAWAKSYLGIQDDFQPGTRPQPTREEMAARAKAARERAEERERQLQAERVKKAGRAKALYLGARPIAHTPAAHYLAGRGIDAGGGWPRSLRYCPDAYCGPLQAKVPAMVATIIDATGAQIGAHRTFLQHSDAGGWGKLQHADVNPKMVLGNLGGGFVPISRGSSDRPMRGMPDGEPVYVTEGIEDALCVRMAKPEARIVCAIALGNIGAIVLPEQARRLIIVADRDENEKAQDTLERAIARQQARGLAVQLVMPPPGVKDINDWMRTLAAPERRRA